MRFVKITRTGSGFSLDPTEYLDRIRAIAEQLPSEASAFARDPEHYNFYGTRCVKDLKTPGHESHGRERGLDT